MGLRRRSISEGRGWQDRQTGSALDPEQAVLSWHLPCPCTLSLSPHQLKPPPVLKEGLPTVKLSMYVCLTAAIEILHVRFLSNNITSTKLAPLGGKYKEGAGGPLHGPRVYYIL